MAGVALGQLDDRKARVSFDVTHRLEGARGRAGVIHTPHGDIETPAFVVVGTKATVKSVLPETVAEP